MAALVVDTHAVLWYIFDDPRLSAPAIKALDAASDAGDPIYVPTICLVETTYLVDKSRLPLLALERLTQALTDPLAGFAAAALDLDVARVVRQIPRDAIPDLPDRVIAATALARQLPLVTRDERIRAAQVETIW